MPSKALPGQRAGRAAAARGLVRVSNPRPGLVRTGNEDEQQLVPTTPVGPRCARSCSGITPQIQRELAPGTRERRRQFVLRRQSGSGDGAFARKGAFRVFQEGWRAGCARRGAEIPQRSRTLESGVAAALCHRSTKRRWGRVARGLVRDSNSRPGWVRTPNEDEQQLVPTEPGRAALPRGLVRKSNLDFTEPRLCRKHMNSHKVLKKAVF